jgi:hypothetical protein
MGGTVTDRFFDDKRPFVWSVLESLVGQAPRRLKVVSRIA